MLKEQFENLKVGDTVIYGGEVHTVDFINGNKKHFIDSEGYGTILDKNSPQIKYMELNEDE